MGQCRFCTHLTARAPPQNDLDELPTAWLRPRHLDARTTLETEDALQVRSRALRHQPNHSCSPEGRPMTPRLQPNHARTTPARLLPLCQYTVHTLANRQRAPRPVCTLATSDLVVRAHTLINFSAPSCVRGSGLCGAALAQSTRDIYILFRYSIYYYDERLIGGADVTVTADRRCRYLTDD